jgi:hypothetical protein
MGGVIECALFELAATATRRASAATGTDTN